MKTLADRLAELPDDSPVRNRLTIVHAEYFRCRCGATVPADMMLDLMPPEVPVAKRLTGEEIPPAWKDDRYRCDACWRMAVAKGEVCPDRLREATGQPDRGEGKPW